jgi:hypothetical protein
MFHNPQRNPARRFEMPIEHERRRVVQLVDDEVVAGLQIERRGDDVLAFAGGEEESDLVSLRANESRELSADLIELR